MGGGTLINNVLKKYGKNSLKKEILEYFDNKTDAFLAEEKYIKESEETKEKIRKKLKGRKIGKFTEEHKRKISESRKGCKVSDETKEKIRKKLKGRRPWNKGLTFR